MCCHKVTLHACRRSWSEKESNNVSADGDNVVQEHLRLYSDIMLLLLFKYGVVVLRL